MVEKYVTIRNKLQSKIFTPYGKSVTLKSKSSPIYNSRGEEEDQTFTSSTISIVPYNIINADEVHEPFGTLEEGELDAAVAYSVTVAVGDKITMESVDYYIKNVQENYLPENVVSIIRLAKVQA
jgi:hypothetical protein